MSDLFGELVISFCLVATTVVIHLAGLMGLIRLTRIHIEHFRTPWLALDRMLVPLMMATVLFSLHAVEVWLYALIYWWRDATSHGLEGALYLSAGSYSTAGWSGNNPVDGWRIVVGFEALNGMLLIGWSTAFLFQTLHRILQSGDNHPLPEGAIAAEASDAAEAADDQAEEDSSAGRDSPRPSRSGKGAPDGTNSSDTELMQ